MRKRPDYLFHFRKFHKKPLLLWQARIIEPMEIQRQRTGMIRAIVHDRPDPSLPAPQISL